MLAGLAQEQLQRIRCSHGRRRWGSVLLLRRNDELDRSAVKLRVDRFELERVELERIEKHDEFHLAQLSARFRNLEQRSELLVDEDRLDLDRQTCSPVAIAWAGSWRP